MCLHYAGTVKRLGTTNILTATVLLATMKTKKNTVMLIYDGNDSVFEG